MKMTFVSACLAVVLQWAFYLPLSPWLLHDVYECKPDVYPTALPYLQTRALGESATRFLEESGAAIIQGMQFLSATAFISLFHGVFSCLATWYIVEVNHWCVRTKFAHLLRMHLATCFRGELDWQSHWVVSHSRWQVDCG